MFALPSITAGTTPLALIMPGIRQLYKAGRVMRDGEKLKLTERGKRLPAARDRRVKRRLSPRPHSTGLFRAPVRARPGLEPQGSLPPASPARSPRLWVFPTPRKTARFGPVVGDVFLASGWNFGSVGRQTLVTSDQVSFSFGMLSLRCQGGAELAHRVEAKPLVALALLTNSRGTPRSKVSASAQRFAIRYAFARSFILLSVSGRSGPSLPRKARRSL